MCMMQFWWNDILDMYSLNCVDAIHKRQCVVQLTQQLKINQHLHLNVKIVTPARGINQHVA